MNYIERLIISGILIVIGIFVASAGLNTFACVSILIAIAIGFVSNDFIIEHGDFPSREEGHRDIRFMMDELTPDERREEEEHERVCFNSNAHTTAWWGDSRDYIDYDGNTVNIY